MRRRTLLKKRSDSGQTLVEYVLLLGLVAVVALLIVSAFLRAGYGIAFGKYAKLFSEPYIYR